METKQLILQTTEYYFKMIAEGKKTEDYRELSYQNRRKFLSVWGNISNGSEPHQIQFRVGFDKKAPIITATVTLSIGTGLPEWGAVPGKKYFILHIQDALVEDRDC